MAHSLIQMLRFPVVTRDRRKPAIRGLLFDDRSWSIRYVVVNVGSWLSECLVVVPAASLRTPDWSRQIVETRLTFDQLSCAPGVETVRPVSRQQQLAWNRHFGWCDRDTHYGNAFPLGFPRQEFRDVEGKDDPHLRSSTDLISYEVWDSSRYVGVLQDFFLEDHSWHIDSLLVKAGDWVFHEEFVPSSRVVAISWGQGRVVVEGMAYAC